MGKIRTADDLAIMDGKYRSYEWFWARNGTMPALDIFETLTPDEQDEILDAMRHWADVPHGIKPLKSRINDEHDNPPIKAIKARKHRFTVFREKSGPTWIVHGYYSKEGEKRDKVGDRAVKRAVAARKEYLVMVEESTYYERD